MFHICRAENMAPDEDWKEVQPRSEAQRMPSNGGDFSRWLDCAKRAAISKRVIRTHAQLDDVRSRVVEKIAPFVPPG